MSEGPEFGEIQPKDSRGLLSNTGPASIVPLVSAGNIVQGAGLDYGLIQPVTPLNSFRVGQQIWFNIQIIQGAPNAANYISRVRLKPWWLVENIEFRAPGSVGGWIGADEFSFGPWGTVTDNRNCWAPSPKRLDQTEFGTPPPPASPPRNSDSIFLDDLWTFDLDDPSNPLYIAAWTPPIIGAPVVLKRTASFYYPAHGMALGLTCEITSVGAPITSVPILLRWKTGATHSHTQESID